MLKQQPFVRKIRVLQVLRPADGGMREHVVSLLSHLNGECFEQGLACPQTSPAVATARKLGVPVFPVEITDRPSPWLDCRTARQLAGIIRDWKAGVVHAHGSKAGLLACLANLLVRPRPGLVLTAHNFVHTGSVYGWKQQVLRQAEKGLLPVTNRVIAVSEALRREILATRGLPPQKVVTVYNGLDFSRFGKEADESAQDGQITYGSRCGNDCHGPLVGTVARFAPQKGVQYFVEMAALLAEQFPGIRFLLVGDGPLRVPLEKQAVALGVADKLIFAGYVKDVVPYLRLMDVFVQPSLSEGLGLSVLEALACRRPVVATKVGGIPEIITHGENGILVPPADARSLAEAAAVLLQNQVLANNLAEQGRYQLEKKFSLDNMLKATGEIYLEVVR